LCNKYVARRVGLAADIARNLEKSWKPIKAAVKRPMINGATVESVFTYNTNTWTLKEEQKVKMRVFEMSVLGKIIDLYRKRFTRDSDIRKH